MSVSSIDRCLSAEAVVQEQLDAYNARDVERIRGLYGVHVKIFRPPVIEPSMVGQEAITRFYSVQRFNLAKLHAALLHRIVLGDVIIDHRQISGVADDPFEIVAIYEVHEGQIQSVWYFSTK